MAVHHQPRPLQWRDGSVRIDATAVAARSTSRDGRLFRINTVDLLNRHVQKGFLQRRRIS
jgi:hypothetical protein